MRLLARGHAAIKGCGWSSHSESLIHSTTSGWCCKGRWAPALVELTFSWREIENYRSTSKYTRTSEVVINGSKDIK